MSTLARLPLVSLSECYRQFNERFGRDIKINAAEENDFIALGNLSWWAKEHGERMLGYYFDRYAEASLADARKEVGRVSMAA